MLKHSQLFLTDLMEKSEISIPSQALDSADSVTDILNSVILSYVNREDLFFI